MRKNKLVAPVLKWVGGKRQLLESLTPLLPKNLFTISEVIAPEMPDERIAGWY